MIFTDHDDFYLYLMEEKPKWIDVATYTLGYVPTLPFRRVIACKPLHIVTSLKNVRLIPDFHAKLWIVQFPGKRDNFAVFVGSMNLCAGTIAELMVSIDRRSERAVLRNIYEGWWRMATPKELCAISEADLDTIRKSTERR